MAKAVGGVRSAGKLAGTQGVVTKADLEKIRAGFSGMIQALREWIKIDAREMGLTDEEATLINSYTNNLYRPLNRNILDGNTDGITKFTTEKLNAVLDKVPVFKGTVWRQVNKSNGEAFIEKLRNSKSITFESFTSTGREDLTTNFKYENLPIGKNRQVYFKIKSKSGRDIVRLSHYFEEGEVLFKTGTRFKVNKIVKSEGKSQKYLVNLTEI